MMVAIVPHFEQLSVVVNPDGNLNPEVCSSSYVPGLYAPWPDARERGFTEIDVKGDMYLTLSSPRPHPLALSQDHGLRVNSSCR